MKGEGPCIVFKVSSIKEAKEAFRELRCSYDFAYWAATKFKIRDISDPEQIVTLALNEHQHCIIDTFQKRYFKKLPGRYIITKQSPRIGVTTCVQAYILWLQTYSCCCSNSQTCSANEFANSRLRENIYRHLGKTIFPVKKKITLFNGYIGAYFNTVRNPDSLRGIDFSYVHLANMSSWRDRDMTLSSRAFNAAISGILHHYFTLIVIEGDLPKSKYFNLNEIRSPEHPAIPTSQYRLLIANPHFLHLLTANAIPLNTSSTSSSTKTTAPTPDPPYRHIPL